MASQTLRPPRPRPPRLSSQTRWAGGNHARGKPLRHATLDDHENEIDNRVGDYGYQDYYDYDAENHMAMGNVVSQEHLHERGHDVDGVKYENEHATSPTQKVSKASKTNYSLRRAFSYEVRSSTPRPWNRAPTLPNPMRSNSFGAKSLKGRTLSKLSLPSPRRKAKTLSRDLDGNVKEMQNQSGRDLRDSGTGQTEFDPPNSSVDDFAFTFNEEEERDNKKVSEWEGKDDYEALESMIDMLDPANKNLQQITEGKGSEERESVKSPSPNGFAAQASAKASMLQAIGEMRNNHQQGHEHLRTELKTNEVGRTNPLTTKTTGLQATRIRSSRPNGTGNKIHPPHTLAAPTRPPLPPTSAPISALRNHLHKNVISSNMRTRRPDFHTAQEEKGNKSQIMESNLKWTMSGDGEESVEINLNSEGKPINDDIIEDGDEEDPQIRINMVESDISSMTGTMWTKETQKRPPEVPRSIPNITRKEVNPRANRQNNTVEVSARTGESLAPHQVSQKVPRQGISYGKSTQLPKSKITMNNFSRYPRSNEEVEQKRAYLAEKFRRNRGKHVSYPDVVEELQRRIQQRNLTDKSADIQEALHHLRREKPTHQINYFGSQPHHKIKQQPQVPKPQSQILEPHTMEPQIPTWKLRQSASQTTYSPRAEDRQMEVMNGGPSNKFAPPQFDIPDDEYNPEQSTKGRDFGPSKEAEGPVGVFDQGRVAHQYEEYEGYLMEQPTLDSVDNNTFDDEHAVMNSWSLTDGPIWSTLGNYGTWRTDVDGDALGFEGINEAENDLGGISNYQTSRGVDCQSHLGQGIFSRARRTQAKHVSSDDENSSSWTDRVMNKTNEEDAMMHNILSSEMEETAIVDNTMLGMVDGRMKSANADAKSIDGKSVLVHGVPPSFRVVQHEPTTNENRMPTDEGGQIWVIAAVSAAAAVLTSGGAQDVAQAAANTVLLSGKRSNDFRKAAAEASVAILDAGGSPISAAAAAVAIMEMDLNTSSAENNNDPDILSVVMEESSKHSRDENIVPDPIENSNENNEMDDAVIPSIPNADTKKTTSSSSLQPESGSEEKMPEDVDEPVQDVSIEKASENDEPMISAGGRHFTVLNLKNPVIMTQTENGMEMFYMNTTTPMAVTRDETSAEKKKSSSSREKKQKRRSHDNRKRHSQSSKSRSSTSITHLVDNSDFVSSHTNHSSKGETSRPPNSNHSSRRSRSNGRSRSNSRSQSNSCSNSLNSHNMKDSVSNTRSQSNSRNKQRSKSLNSHSIKDFVRSHKPGGQVQVQTKANKSKTVFKTIMSIASNRKNNRGRNERAKKEDLWEV